MRSSYKSPQDPADGSRPGESKETRWQRHDSELHTAIVGRESPKSGAGRPGGGDRIDSAMKRDLKHVRWVIQSIWPAIDEQSLIAQAHILGLCDLVRQRRATRSEVTEAIRLDMTAGPIPDEVFTTADAINLLKGIKL